MKVTILGHFADGSDFCDGQTVKTRMLFNGFTKFTDYELTKIDTYKWKKHPLKLVKNIKKSIKNSDILIMLPASNGVKVFVPLVNYFNKKNSCKIFYSVIGAWLAKLVKDKPRLSKSLQKLDGIWVETNTLKNELAVLNITNVQIVNNFKDVDIALVDKQAIYNSKPKSFCTFSRVIKEKGITLAIETIAKINSLCDDLNFNNKKDIEIIAKLYIYGPIGEDYKKEFFDLVQKYSMFVEYKGVVNPSDSAKIISEYYCLLFPTLFATEGIPGTIIDSYFAGTPIIASKWNSCYDILNDDCALIYDFQSYEKGLLECIIAFINMEEKIYLRMTDNCFIESKKYEMENVIYQLINEMLMEKEVL